MKGYVYVLGNECMPGIYKIGCTTKTVKERISELSSPTNMPLPFVEELSFYVLDVDRAEKKMHEELKEYRINKDREFFKVDLETIENASKCLYPDYMEILNKLREDVIFTGEVYFKERYRSFLDNNLKTLKEQKYNFEYFTGIFKKGNAYYIAACHSKICTEEEYQEWVVEKCKEDCDSSGEEGVENIEKE